MKTKILLPIAIAAILTIALYGTSYAFHSGGVAECGGCHSMHSPKPGGSYLLLGTDKSSTCLNCHEHAGDTGPTSYHISTAEADMPAGTAPLQRTPGGDFGWLKKSYTFTVRGNPITEEGYTHGHNIIAADFNYVVDPHNNTAPGGLFPSAQLSCISCHNPHGKHRRLSDGTISTTGAPIIASGSYNTSPQPQTGEAVGVYRLLAGNGYTQDGVTFQGVPVAVAPSGYNRSEASTQTRVAYGHSESGGHVSWGNWCGTCHPDMHSSGNYVHPIDEQLGSTIADIYNAYVKSGDMTGTSTSSFLSLVPFILNIGDYETLKGYAKNDDSNLNGPTNQDRVSCLSCHRAHASGWPEALRWNMEGEFIVYNGLWPGTDNGAPPQFARGRESDETQAAYYDRAPSIFATYQRVLCNKCHAKD